MQVPDAMTLHYPASRVCTGHWRAMRHGRGASFWQIIGSLLVTVTLASCVASINTGKMVPVIDYSAFNKGGKTLALASVTCKAEAYPISTPLLISDGAYREVLRDSIGRSGIFKEVSLGQSGDFLLKAEIVSQKLIAGLTANAVLFVHYELINAKTQEKVWQDSILSQYDSYGGDPQNIVEGSARDNITQLLAALNALPSAQ